LVADKVGLEHVVVRLFHETDLPEADRIFRLAFGTQLRLPDPVHAFGDADYIRTRWRANPTAAFGAEINGRLVASQFVTNWGSVGFFGPLTVHPDYWGRGIAQRLIVPTMELFVKWGTTHEGLFTFAESGKHIGLYQKFGFWPRFLTAIMEAPSSNAEAEFVASTYSDAPRESRPDLLRTCAELTTAVYPGLDVSREIQAIDTQRLGKTLLLREAKRLVAIAVCHCGPGTEGGSGTCYVKFGAVRPGPKASKTFDALLDACLSLARSPERRKSSRVPTSRGKKPTVLCSREASGRAFKASRWSEADPATIDRAYSSSTTGAKVGRPVTGMIP
jgi:GNAT superfamily N-acetyltransferase